MLLRFSVVYKSGNVYSLIQRSRMGNSTSTTSGRVSDQACSQFIQETVSHNCIVIFSKTTCPYCKMAKNVFNQIGATYRVIELDEHNNGQQIQDVLEQISGARTVPRVFINGQCIGGSSDTRQLHEQGKLLPLIEKCNLCCLNNT
ncbi:glutaredoxin 2 isoform X2 [Silurus meridionalis]|uniref:Glutaredoxin-2, mitochondrial n=1 Tax=Silurus meridionalis TaxID=175797 RepID=A0A8T0B9K5_SILME|nr:glutaredoxin 2 isoform X2 [Silurus meridionalis]KAF7703618.1 hypothetical protein HF521_022625 [Silurus meridionalis]